LLRIVSGWWNFSPEYEDVCPRKNGVCIFFWISADIPQVHSRLVDMFTSIFSLSSSESKFRMFLKFCLFLLSICLAQATGTQIPLQL
jgi:hypothetical protein